MTTGDGAAPAGPPFDASRDPAGAGATPAAPGPPAGLPDASVMAQWANEFFTAVQGGAPVAPPGLPVGVDAPSLSSASSAPAVPYAATAGTGNLPPLPYVASSASTLPQLSEKDFRAAPQQILGGAEKGSQVAGQRPSYGASPGGVPGAALYFIEAANGARGAVPNAPATNPYPSPTHPLPQFSEKDFRSAPQSVLGGGGKAPQLAGRRSDAGAPPAGVPGLALQSHSLPQFSEKDFRSAPQSIAGLTGSRAPSPEWPQAAAGAAPPGEFNAPLYFLPLEGAPTDDTVHAPAVATQAAPHEEHLTRVGHEGGESVGFHPHVVPDLKLETRQFDAGFVKRDFPILTEQVNGRSLVWLDNAATTQKPRSVIDRIAFFYEHENSNIHRGGAHTLAGRATEAYEGAREKVRAFLNAPSVKNIVFTRGTTESVNLVAQSWGRRHLQKDDEVVITWLEHHSNIVPWQLICAERGARLRVAPIDGDGQIKLDEYERLLGPRTRLVAFTQVSNALGTITPAAEMIAMAHRHGAKVLLDGAQSVSHMRVDVQSLDCDFFVFSGHKVFGPTGIGALFGKTEVLESMPPWQGGGNMISDVTFEKTAYHPPPMRFEAGTGNIADAVGLDAAIDYVEHIGLENIGRHEHDLLVYGTEELKRIPGLRLIGTAREKAAVMSFVIEGIPYEAVAQALGNEGIAVRAGHHCAQPAVRHFGLEGTVRPSLALYNTVDDIDALVDTLRRFVHDRGSRRG